MLTKFIHCGRIYKKYGENAMPTVFNKKIIPACKYCVYSTVLSFGEDILCKKRGFNDKDACCRHYKYDPLKRQPNKITLKNDFSKEDFNI